MKSEIQNWYIGLENQVFESLPDVVELVHELGDAVYPVDGDRYLDVHADADFGTVAALPAAETGRGAKAMTRMGSAPPR